MGLSKCLRKAGEAIAREDKVAILAKAKELRESGLENATAARKAVLELLEGSRATLTKMHADAGLAEPDFARKEKPEPREMPQEWQVGVAPRLDVALRRWGKGEGTEVELAAAVKARLEEQRAQREDALGRDRVRGPDWVRERLLRARRNDEINPAMADLTLWMLDRNPHLATDLALSITTKKMGGDSGLGVQGMYDPVDRLVKLFTNAGNEETGVHEILHHTERMMPRPVQDGIRREWVKQLAAEVTSAKRKLLAEPVENKDAPKGWGSVEATLSEKERSERAQFLDAMVVAARAGDSELTAALYRGEKKKGVGPGLDGALPYELSTSSEFWAVNGARIMHDRAVAEGGGWVSQAKQWLRELVDKAKYLLRLPSDAAVLKGLKAVLNGDGSRQTNAMLANRKGPINQITPEQALDTNVPRELPEDDPMFKDAVANTPAAKITPDGLLIDVTRFQKEEQEGAQAIRTGVFYLPTGSAAAKHYKTGKTGYGGVEKMQGETLIRRPLFVKGATGGKAPEVAYDTLNGKKAYDAMRGEVLKATLGGCGRPDSQKVDRVREVLEKYGADPGLAQEIVLNSREGNTLPYAVQENIVAHAVRDAGYDAVVGYSKGKAGPFISEVFDVREQTYPARGMDSQVHDKFMRDNPDFSRKDHTDSPEFKAWFGDSKVVGKDGEPLVVYHGAPDIRFVKEGGDGTFKSPKERLLGANDPERAFFFTADERVARTYADPRRAFDYQNAEEGVVPTYLKLENPLRIDHAGGHWHGTRNAVERARLGGHDGVIITNVRDDYNNVKGGTKPTTVYVVLDPTQIKSADNNSGAFDPKNPDIRFSAKSEEERRQSHGFHTREIQVDGKWRPIEDSSGRLLARGDFRGQQNFHRWFGDSKIVDSRGRPLLVYHGTSADFSEFRTTEGNLGEGIYLTSHAPDASDYAENSADQDGGPPNVMPLYASIKNPLVIKQDETGPHNFEEVQRLLKPEHDGVWLKLPYGDEIMALHPEQVKSAIGNRGTYQRTPPAFDGSPDTFSAKGGTHGRMGDADFLANLAQSRTFKEHGLGGLDVPSQNMVFARVLSVLHDRQIANAVVKLVPIDVVNVLAREKLAPEVLLHDPAMLADLFAIDGHKPVAMDADAAREVADAVAAVTAKYLAAHPDAGRAAGDRSAALSARSRDARSALGGGVTGVAAKDAAGGRALGVESVDGGAAAGAGVDSHYAIAYDSRTGLSTIKDYDGSNPDIRFARKGTTAATANLPASAPLGTWERSKSVVSDLIDEGLTKSGVYKFTSPMSEGSTRAKAIAQNFANAERQARREWQRVQDVIAKDFPDKTVREKMWNAADQENEILSGRLAPSPSVGLASLTPRQRDVVEQLHAYGEELLQRAKDVGMFSGDGVPYWTPRMMVMLDANGEYTRPVEPGKKQTSGGDGRNVFTSSSNLKQRKYLTSAETEAAMQAKGGELVRDITTMPMAMQRLERAIAGRELINQVKDLGRATGTATVSNSMHEGFFTLDHPSFTRFQPRFEKDPATGNSVAMQDSHGNIILDRVPLYMSREFEGPIKAILSNTDGTAYRAYMLLKSKAMSAIMFSPAIHQMVIFGRALGYDPTLVGTVGLYFRGNAAKKDDALVREAIEGGLVPMGGNHAGMIDITDVARGIGREGGLGDPNESWIAHGAKFIVGAVNKDAGAAAKRFIDRAGEYWHGTLLWDRVGDLQMGIFAHAYERLQSEGFDPKVAAVMAAHWGNRYAGAVGRENMGEYARKAANVLLFSRSFNAGNWGTIKDMAYGMPAGLRAKIEFEHGKGAAGQAYTEARRKAIAGFIADAALSLIALSLAQTAVDKLKKDKGWDEIFGGYMDRAGRMAGEIKRHPFTPKSYSPWQLSPTHDNEPHKQDRVDMGEIPGAGGRHEYMRLPTGKVVEDLINWTSHPAETFSAKMSPLAKAAWQIVSNDKGFGVPVYDPDGSMAGFGMDVAKHLAKAQTPWDTIVTAWDKMQGKTTQIENAKLLGNMTGFSASQGHPQGPEAGVAAEVEERIKAQKLMAMEEVKRLLKYDKEDQAREKLEAVGLTPREVNQVIKKIENPKEMTPSQRRKFNSHSTDEDQQRMERVTR